MLKKPITYKDIDDNEVTEEFYFALNEAEIAELELSQKGGLAAYANRLTEEKDSAEIYRILKDLILRTVGERKDNRFVKNEEIREEFIQTNAYSALIMSFFKDASLAVDFIKGVMPSDLQHKISEIESGKTADAEVEKLVEKENQGQAIPAWVREDRDLTAKEQQEATKEQLVLAMQMKQARLERGA